MLRLSLKLHQQIKTLWIFCYLGPSREFTQGVFIELNVYLTLIMTYLKYLNFLHEFSQLVFIIGAILHTS